MQGAPEFAQTEARDDEIPSVDRALSILDDLGPSRIVDLVLAFAVRRGGSLVSLFPEVGRAVLTVQIGSARLAALSVSGDVATAAITRLAWLSGLDPLVEAGTIAGQGNLRRVRVKVGSDEAEVLVGIDAGVTGLRAEVRALLVNGVAPVRTRPVQLKKCLVCGAYQAPQRVTCEEDNGPLVELHDDPRPGGTIGMYVVGEPLGDGGMGTVLAARHALIDRPVAIKLLHPSGANNPVLVRRFLSEARAACRLHHPSILDVTDFGLLDDEQPFLVMERLDGESLEARLLRSGPMPPKAALILARVIAVALGAAHDAGVVHNDLKPSNVVLLEGSTDEAPLLKLVDFGAASLLGAHDTDGFLVGTPKYMAPEHARGEVTDRRSDLYALGVVLYEMLSGAPPFLGKTAKDVLYGQLFMPPPTLRSPGGALPVVIHRVLDRLLSKQAAERHQTAAELIGDLDRALASLDRPDWKQCLP